MMMMVNQMMMQKISKHFRLSYTSIIDWKQIKTAPVTKKNICIKTSP